LSVCELGGLLQLFFTCFHLFISQLLLLLLHFPLSPLICELLLLLFDAVLLLEV
jgi:hypothetical protein